MPYFRLAAALAALSILQGCSPTYNWRDVRPDQTPLVALFPCKPDQHARMVSLARKDVTMTMWGCDAGGATFTLAYADMKDIAGTGAVLAQWKSLTLANLRARSVDERPFLLRGASVLPQSVQVAARGTQPDGTAVTVQAAWFAVGTLVYQAAMYAGADNVAVADTFLTGIRLQ